ncbi:MAG: phosphatase PAP2 family protein [Pseudomonadota bacterium]|nr:phosphatase PAP2 family protein [Pseudomonadota bacterium]
MTLPLHHALRRHHRVFRATVSGFLLLAAWDYGGPDLAMAGWFGTAQGFSLENHWFWRQLLHDDIRLWPWALELGLLAGIVWPWGSLRQLPALRRGQLALTTLAALLLVSTLKLHSHTSCPWELAQFGGVASHVSHWAWGVRDGGHGGCFPAGHASGGFAFIGGFFVFRRVLPHTAWRWLVGATAAGLLFGLAQQVRGAHYMSHTLWTAWFCWTVAATADGAVSWLMAQQARRGLAPGPVLTALVPLRPQE